MYRIGEFSKLTKTTIKALRYYDDVGLLKPEKIDKFTNYRFYTTNQLMELHRIQSLRQIGLSIEEIKLVLHNKVSTEIVLKKRKAEVLSEIADGQDQLSRIEFILSGQEEEIFMNYQAIVKELPECIVYSKEMTVSNYGLLSDIIPTIGEQLLKKYPNIKCSVPEYCFITYLDGEYREKDVNVEFCEAVETKMPDFEDIKFKKIDSVLAVSVMHKGGYNSLPQAYSFAFKWIEQNGYTAVDNPRENYIDGVWNKESEENWLTEVQVPISKIV